MHCDTHEAEATGACPFCGRAYCRQCTVLKAGSRRACSDGCLAGLLMQDEATVLAVTKTKRTLKANVMFCMFLGGVFVVTGLGFYLIIPSGWLVAAVLSGLGFAFMLGGLIYAHALREGAAM